MSPQGHWRQKTCAATLAVTTALTGTLMVSYPYIFEITPRSLAFFTHHKIFLAHSQRIADVHPMGTKLRIGREVRVETYATLPHGGFLSVGAFSYVLSRLEQRVTVGRYCSIAKGCEILGIDHPTDWISSHLFTFRAC